MASFTTILTVKIKRTDFLGRIGWLFGVERWKYKTLPGVVSVTWTKEDYNKLLYASDVQFSILGTVTPAEHGKWYPVGDKEGVE